MPPMFGKKLISIPLFCCSFLITTLCFSQSYHALNGSKYAGLLGSYYNPASIVNSVYQWDLSLFAAQSSIANNLVKIKGFSLSNYDTATASITEGKFKRYLHQNSDFQLFNATVHLGKLGTVGLALRTRTYNHTKTDDFLWIDSLNSTSQILRNNYPNPQFDAFATHAGWFQLDLSYANQVIDNPEYSLALGGTLQILRSVSAAYAQVRGINYRPVANLPGIYTLTAVEFSANYSTNIDGLDGDNFSRRMVDSFIQNSKIGLGLSFGAEWVQKLTDRYDVNDEEQKGDYNWKAGFSVMDIGANKFVSSVSGFTASDVNTQRFANRFFDVTESVSSLRQMQDSARVYFNNVQAAPNEFTVQLPTRFIFYADKNWGNGWYTGVQMNINWYSTQPKGKLKTREINFLTINPRWEKRAIGVYLPIQFTTQARLLVGAAVKLGPLVVGLHNLNWLSNKYTQLNGGGYIVLKMGILPKKAVYKSYNCASIN